MLRDTYKGKYDDWLQLPLVYDGSEVQTDSLLVMGSDYYVRQTEDSKSQLQLRLTKWSLRMKLQRESIIQLHHLVDEFVVNDQAGQLWQLHDIEDQLHALQSTKNQTSLLLCIYSTWLQEMCRDKIGENMQIVTYRLNMMHETNDSVWLLCDGLDWLLREVQIILLLQHTAGDTTNRCSGYGQGEAQLLRKFISRLEDWRGSLGKQQRIHSELSSILHFWPKYSWVRFHFMVG